MTTRPAQPPRRRQRFGAGAPRGNRNARRPRHSAAAVALDLFRDRRYRRLRATLPSQVYRLLLVALHQLIDQALLEAARASAHLTAAEAATAQRRAVSLAGDLILAAFADAWLPPLPNPRRLLRKQSGRTPERSLQSRSESGRRRAINLNQARPPAQGWPPARRHHLTSRPQTTYDPDGARR